MVRFAVLFAALVSTAAVAQPAFAAGVAVRTFRFADRTRTAHFRNGATRPRTLVTIVRYPEGRGPFPLIVFAHGFTLTPAAYARLLDAWAHAGFAVAAPVFPLESANAPGGPDESDLLNEPADIRFVITRLLKGPLHGVIDPRRIGVAGQSDGGVAALATAYATRLRDRRIDAAAILSGAQPRGPRFAYGPHRPPLLAVQGTADPINAASNTRAFFANAERPKFLLSLIGASHLPPYTTNLRELAVVERATIAFFDRYLRGAPLAPLLAVARPGVAELTADP